MVLGDYISSHKDLAVLVALTIGGDATELLSLASSKSIL